MQISTNNKLGVLKRIAYGFTNADNFAAQGFAVVSAGGIMRWLREVGSSHEIAKSLKKTPGLPEAFGLPPI